MLRQTFRKKARPARMLLIIEQCWPAYSLFLPETLPDAADVRGFEPLALLHYAGPASHGVQSGQSPTESEARQTWPRAHPRILEHRRVIPRDRPA